MPADVALTRGDVLMAQQPREAADGYRRAPAAGSRRLATSGTRGSLLVQALQDSKQWQQCAETAIRYATMKRDDLFVRAVVSGMWCLSSAGSAPWVDAQLRVYSLLRRVAVSPITVRDHRDSIYRTLMNIEVALKHAMRPRLGGVIVVA